MKCRHGDISVCLDLPGPSGVQPCCRLRLLSWSIRLLLSPPPHYLCLGWRRHICQSWNYHNIELFAVFIFLPCMIFETEPILHWSILLHQFCCLHTEPSSHEIHSILGGPGHMTTSLLAESVRLCPGAGAPLHTSGPAVVAVSSSSTGQPTILGVTISRLR